MRWLLLLVLFCAGCAGHGPNEPTASVKPARGGVLARQDTPKVGDIDQAVLDELKGLCDQKRFDVALEVVGRGCEQIHGCSLNQLAEAALDWVINWALFKTSMPAVAEKARPYYSLSAQVCHALNLHRHEFYLLAILYAADPSVDTGKQLLHAVVASKQMMVLSTIGKVSFVEAVVSDFTTRYPDNLTGKIYQARLKFLNRRYVEAETQLNEMLTTAEKTSPAELPEIYYWEAMTALNLGKFVEAYALAAKGLDACEKSGHDAQDDLFQAMHDCLQAQKMGIYLSFAAPEFLPLGFYHLMSETHGPLPPFLELLVVNGEERDKMLIFTSEVLDVTYASVDQFVLPARGKDEKRARFNMRVYQTPPIRRDFKAAEVTESVERPIRITVAEKTDAGEKVLLTRTIPVSVWPRTRHVPLLPTRGGDLIVNQDAAAAWVMPRGRWVEQAIREAKKYLPGGMEFYGWGGKPETARDQVAALYKYLKTDKQVSYVGASIGFEKGCFYQDLRLPSESVRSSNALCLEGAVVFATLLEAIGLEPIIVFKPGHAFVGWFDVNGPIRFRGRGLSVLETTAIFTCDYAKALELAEKQWTEEKIGENVNKTVYDVLEIRVLRERGYLPQPFPEP